MYTYTFIGVNIVYPNPHPNPISLTLTLTLTLSLCIIACGGYSNASAASVVLWLPLRTHSTLYRAYSIFTVMFVLAVLLVLLCFIPCDGFLEFKSSSLLLRQTRPIGCRFPGSKEILLPTQCSNCLARARRKQGRFSS